MTSELKLSAKSGGTMSWVPPFTHQREAGANRPGPTSALERLLMSSGAGRRTNHKPNKPNKLEIYNHHREIAMASSNTGASTSNLGKGAAEEPEPASELVSVLGL